MYIQRDYFKNSPDFQERYVSVPGVQIFINTKNLTAVMFSGGRKKYDWFHRFESFFKMEQFIDLRVKAKYDSIIHKEERKKLRNQKAIALREDVKVGDIFCTHWGYEQTNIDFFQVVAKPSKTRVLIREIAKQTLSTYGMGASIKPIPNHFVSAEKKCFITLFGSISKADQYGHSAFRTSADKEHNVSWGY